jgi:putative NIF3 family GTP cyclohydrolase 1 type 2
MKIMPSLLQRVVRSMESIAPVSLSESWDNTGLLIEAPIPRPNANGVFLTIDLTQQVLDEAIRNQNIAVIIAYHPPIFKLFKKLCLQDHKQKIALLCIVSILT